MDNSLIKKITTTENNIEKTNDRADKGVKRRREKGREPPFGLSYVPSFLFISLSLSSPVSSLLTWQSLPSTFFPFFCHRFSSNNRVTPSGRGCVPVAREGKGREGKSVQERHDDTPIDRKVSRSYYWCVSSSLMSHLSLFNVSNRAGLVT